MRADFRILRAPVVSGAFAIGAALVAALLALAAPPAQAYWTTVTQTGCITSTDCPTVDVACQKWADRWRPGYPLAAPAGVLIWNNQSIYCIIATVPSSWPIQATCPYGEYADPFSSTGCRDYPNTQLKNAGPSRPENPTPVCGNPVTVGTRLVYAVNICCDRSHKDDERRNRI